MLKSTLYFSRPCYLCIKDRQLVYNFKDDNSKDSYPVEDLGFVILDNNQIILSYSVVTQLSENNVAVVFCDKQHMPSTLAIPLNSNSKHSKIVKAQLECKLPVKKRIWQQIVAAKITNQRNLLKKLGKTYSVLDNAIKNIKSDDSTNREAVAAKAYWKNLFQDIEFRRKREGDFPNSLLNYGYSILRSAVARALVGSGLHLVLSIHHRGQYNPSGLADDMMEPYRPFIDEIVFQIVKNNQGCNDISKSVKKELLESLTTDVRFKDITRPLMIGLSFSSSSLVRCLLGEEDKISYPVLE